MNDEEKVAIKAEIQQRHPNHSILSHDFAGTNISPDGDASLCYGPRTNHHSGMYVRHIGSRARESRVVVGKCYYQSQGYKYWEKRRCILDDEEKKLLSEPVRALDSFSCRHKHLAESHGITMRPCISFTPNGRVLHATSIWYSLSLGLGRVYKMHPPWYLWRLQFLLCLSSPSHNTYHLLFRKTPNTYYTMRCISLFVLVLSSLTILVSSAPIAIPVPEAEVDHLLRTRKIPAEKDWRTNKWKTEDILVSTN
ncbi:hypothetical protein EV421DRAFT_892142 [Armillaria borealis]|uniref:Uncharacterized protein n=1 Tax=Armillaria borealis TaxID=47425 RepID=A0AA39K0I6_9AGAR|nr:hypothetical protein EV421DRAFT_892142 [Armillaria borealis]